MHHCSDNSCIERHSRLLCSRLITLRADSNAHAHVGTAQYGKHVLHRETTVQPDGRKRRFTVIYDSLELACIFKFVYWSKSLADKDEKGSGLFFFFSISLHHVLPTEHLRSFWRDVCAFR